MITVVNQEVAEIAMVVEHQGIEVEVVKEEAAMVVNVLLLLVMLTKVRIRLPTISRHIVAMISLLLHSLASLITFFLLFVCFIFHIAYSGKLFVGNLSYEV